MDELKLLFTALKDSIEGFDNISDEEIENIISDEAEQVHNYLQYKHQESLISKAEQVFNLDSEDLKKEIKLIIIAQMIK